MNTIAKLRREVNPLQLATLSGYPRRKLREQTDSAAEVLHKLHALRRVLEQYSCDRATPQQTRFLRARALPVIDSLEIALRLAMILPQVRDEAEVQQR